MSKPSGVERGAEDGADEGTAECHVLARVSASPGMHDCLGEGNHEEREPLSLIP